MNDMPAQRKHMGIGIKPEDLRPKRIHFDLDNLPDVIEATYQGETITLSRSEIMHALRLLLDQIYD